MGNLSLIQGDCQPTPGHRSPREDVGRVVLAARRSGYTVGRSVLLGKVAGTIIGYNIGDQGLYYASRFPLLVETSFGIIKCNPEELRLQN